MHERRVTYSISPASTWGQSRSFPLKADGPPFVPHWALLWRDKSRISRQVFVCYSHYGSDQFMVSGFLSSLCGWKVQNETCSTERSRKKKSTKLRSEGGDSWWFYCCVAENIYASTASSWSDMTALFHFFITDHTCDSQSMKLIHRQSGDILKISH